MSFDTPLALLLLPLALLPLYTAPGGALANAWAAQLARDRASVLLQWALRGAAVLAIAALVFGLAGPYRPEATVERIGRGAEVVLVLDRSRSMDQGFAGARPARAVAGTGPEALAYYSTLRAAIDGRESKGQVARRLLAAFTAERQDDRFGMVVFSNVPMRVLEFTQKQPAIQAAISAANIGRGLAETHIALALEAALGFFADRPYTGSRILLLVSDGGDRIDVDARQRITQLARRYRVAVYWIYIRSPLSPGLTPASDAAASAADGSAAAAGDSVPELFLHRFFESLGVPYRAYEADNPQALQKAIADLSRLENLPIAYRDTLPRQDLSGWAYAAAWAAVLLLLAANLAEIRQWG